MVSLEVYTLLAFLYILVEFFVYVYILLIFTEIGLYYTFLVSF